jgi:hypothetical protein
LGVADLFFRVGEVESPDACCDAFDFEWHPAHSGSWTRLPFLSTSHVVTALHLLQ